MTGGADFHLEPVDFASLDGWTEDDPRALFPALRRCAEYVSAVKPYRPGAIGLTAGELVDAIDGMPDERTTSTDEARAFIESRFQPFLVTPASGGRGFVTAFYEPEVAVSESPNAEFCFPFYRRPDDLVDVDEHNAPPGWDPGYQFARVVNGVIEPYPDRKAIDEGFLAGRGLEIAWARSRVDVFFAHVQGAARLRYGDGRLGRITYAAKAGHPFSGIGRLLVDQGEIPDSEISMQAIRDWLARHPDRMDEVLWYNRSYIFFREAPVDDPTLGPVAAAKVPLVAGRSLAVDRRIHTFGFPFFIRAERITHMDGGRPFARLMLALDTGSAIIGPARGDIFTGSGDEAGEMAGAVRSAADFFLLVPRPAAGRLTR